MTTHNTPRHAPNQTGPEAAEPARRASRFDERGIALQTVIIMVVLLAIAGGVAAVLLTRGSEATSELQAQEVTVSAYSYGNAALCRAAGHEWVKKSTLTNEQKDEAKNVLGVTSLEDDVCKPSP